MFNKKSRRPVVAHIHEKSVVTAVAPDALPSLPFAERKFYADAYIWSKDNGWRRKPDHRTAEYPDKTSLAHALRETFKDDDVLLVGL